MFIPSHFFTFGTTGDISNPNRVVFYPFESVSLTWLIPTIECKGDENRLCGYTQIQVLHGNYVYGKRVPKDGEPYIYGISNWDDFSYIEDYCPECMTYPYQYNEGDPMSDVVLPLSLLERLIMWVMGD